MLPAHVDEDVVETAWQVSDLDGGDTVGEHVDSPLPLASVAKVPLVLVAARQAAAGRLDLATPVTLHPDGRSQGTTGVSAMRDPVTLSLRDAAYLALTISDNAAADAVWDALTPDLIAAELEAMGLAELRLVQPMRELYDDPAAATDPARFAAANAGTPRALVRLLAGLWRDEFVAPAYGAWIRDLMARQVWHERLAPSFAADDIGVAAKSGTFGPFRHEIGVITYPGPRRYAAAVLTHRLTAQPVAHLDAHIGAVARRGVLRLRRGSVV